MTELAQALPGIRIHRIKICDYRGIEDLDVKVGPAGFVVKGECRSGKTSVLNSVLAALTARDVGPDAIRHGRDHAEIFIDLEALTVRRTIDADGSTVKASAAIPHSKQRATVGQKRLDELFGRGISPMALWRSKPEERRKIVMAAMPMRLDARHLEEWLTPEQREALPAEVLQTIYLPTTHGLEAVSMVHRALFEARARANADAKGARGRAEHAHAAAEKFAGVPDADLAQLEAASAARADAQRALDAIFAQAQSAKAFDERTAETRRKIDEKRMSAKELLEGAEAPCSLDIHDADVRRGEERVERLRQQLREVEADLRKLVDVRMAAVAQNARRQAALDKADAICAAANELEASLSHASAPAPTEEERAAVASRLVDARAAYGAALKGSEATSARARAREAADEQGRLESLARGLTATVDFLRNEAAAQLLRESEGIPGLGLEGGELTIDGVRLDALSGAEQLLICVDVAKRASTQRRGEGRVLITDGLEALDPTMLERFLRAATAGGWQLLATRVTEGDLTIEAIGAEEAEAAE